MTNQVARGVDQPDMPPWSGELDFHALAQTLPTLIFVTDARGRCLYTNRRFQHFTGLAAEALLGDRWLDVLHPDDRTRTLRTWNISVATTEPYEVEFRVRAADGEHRWFVTRGSPVREQGRIVRWVGNSTDIDDSKRAEAHSRAQHRQAADALSVSEARFKTIFQSMYNFVGLLGLDGTLLEANDAALRFGGVQAGEVIGRRFWDTPWWNVGSAGQETLRRAIATAAAGRFVRYDAEVRAAGGRVSVVDFSITPVLDASGAVVELIPEGRDLTEARLAEQQLRRSEQRLRSVFAAASIGMARVDLHTGRWLEVNETLCAMLGYGHDELMALPEGAVGAPGTDEADRLRLMAANRSTHFSIEKAYRHKAGQAVWTSLTMTLVRDAHGLPDFGLALLEDISERRRQARMLAEADERRSFLLALADRLRPLADPVAVMAAASEMLGRHLRVAQVGYSEIDPSQLYAIIDRDWNDGRLQSVAGTRRLEDYGPRIIADLRRGVTLAIADVRADGRTSTPEAAASFDRLGVRALLDVPLVKDGAMRAVLFVHNDTPRTWTRAEQQLVEEVCERTWAASQQARAEAAAEAAGQHFRSIIEAVPQMVWSTRPDGYHDYYNRRWYEFTGMPEGSTDGEGWQDLFHPDDRARAWMQWRHSLATGTPYEFEYRLRHRSGAYRWMLGRALPMYEKPGYEKTGFEKMGHDRIGPVDPGRIVRWIGTSTELQSVIEAREALAAGRSELERRVAEGTEKLRQANARLLVEMERRERAQAALAHSQKLEALGQLTAGVSHDFNNVIAAMAGAFSIIERRTEDPRIRDITAHGVKAAWRGAALVRQMLMFARQDTPEPKVVELAALLDEVEPQLRRTVGDDVALTIECPPGLPAVRIDPLQLETAMINLAVNANDAMQGRGRLVVEVQPCPPDTPDRPAELHGYEAVTVRISDDGPGMPPDVLQRVLEPFFTTKGAGKGTGLGLAMVHGFLQQSGGALRIVSRLGHGTDILLYLPCAIGEVDGGVPEDEMQTATDPRLHGGARLLVVDDDDAMRGVLAAQLLDLGYSVVEASGGEAALRAMTSGPEMDALLVDVVMPGMDGRTLAELVRRDRPLLPMLFMTGHADRSQVAGEVVIEKPFTPAALAARLLELLGRNAAFAGLDATMLDRLDARLRSETLRPMFRHWRAACIGGRLPRHADFKFEAGDAGRYLVLLSVDLTRVPMTFRIEQAERGQSRITLKTLGGLDVAITGDEALGSREAAYRRCVRSRRPSYEYARFDLGDGQPVVFERLLLPFSADGDLVSTLVSMVVVDGMPIELGQ